MFLDAPQTLKVTYQPVIEIRERYERRLDRDFNESVADNRSDLFGRYRIGFTAKYGQWKGALVAQWAEDPSWTADANQNVERRDVILAYLSHPVSGGDATVGRQRLKKGFERLLGESNWNNVSNAFDGVRWQSKRLDLFAAKVAVTNTPAHNARVAGAGYTSALGETLYIYKHDDSQQNSINEHTLDQTVRIKKGAASLDFEAAGQLGRRNNAKVEAWATAATLTYRTSPKLAFFANGNLASGGNDADTYRTFDALYGTSHAVYGLLDMQGWRNTQNLGLGARYKARKDLELIGEYYRYGLRDATDGWYTNSGINRRPGGRYIDPTGNSGRDVGSEVALDIRWDYSKNVAVYGGFGVFMPGHFIENLSGDSTNQRFGYVQVSYKF